MYRYISIAAVISYFVPLLIVAIKKAWRDHFFLFFALYWTIGGISNLVDIIPSIPPQTTYIIGVIYNMLDIPFILCILYYTGSFTLVKKTTAAAFFIMLILQFLSVIRFGFSYDSLKYPLGIGVMMVLCIVTMEIIRYMQKVEHTTRQNAKMFVYAAVLFEYATFIVIYIFDYIVTTEDKKDSSIIYYISTLVAILIASCGFLMYRRYENTYAEYLKR